MTQTQHHSPRHGITPSWRFCPWTSTQYISTLGNKHSVQKTIASSQSQNTRKLTEGNYIQFSKTPRILLTKATTCGDRKATVPQSIASHPKNRELHWKDLQTLLPQRNFTMQLLRNKCAGGNERENMHGVHSFERANLCRVLDVAKRLEMISRFARSSRYFALWNRQVAPRANRMKRWRSKDNTWLPTENVERRSAVVNMIKSRLMFSLRLIFSLSFCSVFFYQEIEYILVKSWWSCLFCFLSVVSMLLVLPFEDLFSTFSTYAAFRVKLPAKDDMACCFLCVFSSICLKQCTNIERAQASRSFVAGLVTLRCRSTT
jgi:hypothetical protein